MNKLAPKFRRAVLAAIAACNSSGLDAFIFEGYRTPELQALYYARGRTIIPPDKPVTNARSNLYSWHGYGAAIDTISRSMNWNAPDDWWEAVAQEFELEGCKWGGSWKQRDKPHFQWGRCKPSPSDEARRIYREGGISAVWRAIGAA